MIWFDSIRTAWYALLSNKLRSGLTMLGMVIGVAAVAAIISIGRGATASVQRQLNTLGTDMFSLRVGFRPPEGEGGRPMMIDMGRMQTFTEADLEKLRVHIADMKHVVTSIGFGTEYRVGREQRWMSVQGVYPEHAEMMGLDFKAGRFFSPEEYAEGARVVVVYERTVRDVFPEVENPVGQVIKVMNDTFTIIGVVDQDSGAAGRFFAPGEGALVPYSTLRRVMQWEVPIHEILVQVRPGADLDQVAALGKELLETIHPGMFVEYWSPRSIQDTASSVTGTVTRFAAAIAAISLLVGGVGIMNIMLVSVAERTREIGLRKALGASDEAILVQFLIESLVTGVTGGGLGLVAALAPVHVASKWLQIDIALDVDTIGLALGFAGAIGLVFGVYPALKAAQLDPIAALRQE